MRRCMVPSCSNTAITAWALVPVCVDHFDAIWNETIRYYDKTIGREQRLLYGEIEHMTPWGRKVTANDATGRKTDQGVQR